MRQSPQQLPGVAHWDGQVAEDLPDVHQHAMPYAGKSAMMILQMGELMPARISQYLWLVVLLLQCFSWYICQFIFLAKCSLQRPGFRLLTCLDIRSVMQGQDRHTPTAKSAAALVQQYWLTV